MSQVRVPQGEPNSRKKLNRKIELFSFLTATNLFQVNVSAEASDRTRRPRSSPDRGAKFKEAASLDAAFCVLKRLVCTKPMSQPKRRTVLAARVLVPTGGQI